MKHKHEVLKRFRVVSFHQQRDEQFKFFMMTQQRILINIKINLEREITTAARAETD